MKDCVIHFVSSNNLKTFYNLFSYSVNHDYPTWSSQLKSTYLRNYSIDRFQKVFTETSFIGILAFQGSEAIGFISFSTPNLGVSNCEWLGVRPSYRGQGVGKQLLAAWEQYAASHSSHCVTLICEDDNITFYRKNGFSVVGLIPQYCLGIDFHFLYKQIAEPSFV